MTRWEHKLVTLFSSRDTKELSELGAKGWELVSVATTDQAGLAALRRPLKAPGTRKGRARRGEN